MEMSGIVEKLLKRINNIKEYATDKKHSRQDIIQKLDKEIKFLMGDRTLEVHRLFYGYVQFLYSSYRKDNQSFNEYITMIKYNVGFVEEMEVESKKVRIPRSLSFSKCSQKDFLQVFEHVKTWAMVTYGCDFDLWRENEQV